MTSLSSVCLRFGDGIYPKVLRLSRSRWNAGRCGQRVRRLRSGREVCRMVIFRRRNEGAAKERHQTASPMSVEAITQEREALFCAAEGGHALRSAHESAAHGKGIRPCGDSRNLRQSGRVWCAAVGQIRLRPVDRSAATHTCTSRFLPTQLPHVRPLTRANARSIVGAQSLPLRPRPLTLRLRASPAAFSRSRSPLASVS